MATNIYSDRADHICEACAESVQRDLANIELAPTAVVREAVENYIMTGRSNRSVIRAWIKFYRDLRLDRDAAGMIGRVLAQLEPRQ